MRSTEVGGFGPAPRRWPLLVGGIAALLVLALAVVGAVALLSGGKKTGQAAVKPPATVTTTTAPTLTPSTTAPTTAVAVSATATPPDQVLALPEPTGNDDGVPVGYPQTLAGAVSAAEHFELAYGSTLNPDRGAVIGRIMSAPTFPNAPSFYADGIADTRKSLGLPALASPSDADTFTVTPAAYQARDATPTAVVVLLLSLVSITKPASNTVAPLTTTYHMVWVNNDWRIGEGSDIPSQERSSLTVDPSNRPLATSLGWRYFSG